MSYVKVKEDENEEPIELPLDDDGTLSIANLTSAFPDSSGLKFRTESNTLRSVRFADGKFHIHDNDTIYHTIKQVKASSSVSSHGQSSEVRQSSLVSCEEYEELIDEVMKLKLKVGLLNIGEAAAKLLTQKTKPKSAVSSPQKLSTTSPEKLSPSKAELAVSSLQVSSKASPESISSSSKKVVLPKLPTGELFTALSKLRDVRHNIAHDMKQHRDVEGSEIFLENEIENVLQAQSYLKKRGPECNLFEEEINILKKHKLNF